MNRILIAATDALRRVARHQLADQDEDRDDADSIDVVASIQVLNTKQGVSNGNTGWPRGVNWESFRSPPLSAPSSSDSPSSAVN